MDEDYFFQIEDEITDDRLFILIIYDILITPNVSNLQNCCWAMGLEFKNQHLKRCLQRQSMRS